MKLVIIDYSTFEGNPTDSIFQLQSENAAEEQQLQALHQLFTPDPDRVIVRTSQLRPGGLLLQIQKEYMHIPEQTTS